MKNVLDEVFEHVADAAKSAGLKHSDRLFSDTEMPLSGVENCFTILFPETSYSNPGTSRQYKATDIVELMYLFRAKNYVSQFENKKMSEKIIAKLQDNKACDFGLIPLTVTATPENQLIITTITLEIKRSFSI